MTIAAQACLLLLHRETDYFPDLLTILVYPLTYMVEEKRQVGEHVWQEGTVSRLGETGHRMGSLVLSWGAVKHGAADPSDGKNVVLHEFAHQLDFENHAVDGVPGLATREQQSAWSEVMRTEFASLRAADESGIPTLLNTYGATESQPSFSLYRSRRSSSDHVRCALVTQSCTRNCKTIFDRTRPNIPLSQQIGNDAALSGSFGRRRSASSLPVQRYDYCGCGTIRRYGFGAFQPCG